MSDYLLLRQSNQCPKCRAKRCNATSFCHNCGVKLFASTNFDFEKFERETLIRNWWVWDAKRGFVHRDHIMMPDRAKPLHRIQTIDKKALDPRYGRETTPSQVAQAFKQKENRVRHRRTK